MPHATGSPTTRRSTGHLPEVTAMTALLLLVVVVGVSALHHPWLALLLFTAAVTAGLAQLRVARLARAAQERARAGEARTRALLEQASDVVMVIGDAQVTYVSSSAQRLLGFDEQALLGRRYLELIHPDDRQHVVEFVVGMLDQPYGSGSVECRLQHRDGTWVPVESDCRNLLDDPDVAGFVITSRDVSERKDLEAELEHRAFHDGLTGLANRALLRDRVERTVARGSRHDVRFAVLHLDLDGFKTINDTLGHTIGDHVLVEASRRLRQCIRDADTAARLGGDEFVVLIDDIEDPSAAARIAERMLAALREPMHVGATTVQTSASIGIALDSDGRDAEDLLRNADIAMHMAKRTGKGCFEVFEPSMHVAVVERLRLEADLQRALDAGELLVHYQPMVTLDDGAIVGVEALLRWQHPERGMVSPAQFIPLAEETGLIVPIGRFVLHEACRQLAAWQERFHAPTPLTMSVNVSMRQLSQGDLVRDVQDALSASGIAPEHLTLELTESALVHDPSATIEMLQRLKRLGVQIAVDDFGTGYSSLAYLQRFPVDVLKIDRAFVTGGQQSPALVRAIVDLGHSLRLQTVAEGIERDAELTQFRELHCNLGQGFYFARPGDGRTTEALLRTRFRASRHAPRAPLYARP